MNKKTKNRRAPQVSKAQLIKDYLASHPNARPTEIAEALKKHKISAAYVSNVKFIMRTYGTAASDEGAPAHIIRAAAKFVQVCGGMDKARKALKVAQDVADILSDSDPQPE
jgi:uncharacterized protein related to proFAR isomerase